MPYRRLPNTDKSRFRALRIAYEKGELHPIYELPFSHNTLIMVASLLPKFEKEAIEYQETIRIQNEKKQNHSLLLKKARVYLAHFIQVYHLAVIREEIKEDTANFYGLTPGNFKLPNLNSQAAVIDWGRKIIEGENERIARGGSPIYSPSIATVSVHYNILKDSCAELNLLKQPTRLKIKQFHDIREQVDQLIVQLWNEIEQSFTSSNQERYKKAQEFGVVYYLRKGEQW